MPSCYRKAGRISRKTTPCNHTALLDGKHTSCCEPGNLCLTNGLCRDANVNDATNYAWRFGCTDETFADPSCANSCNNITGYDNQLTWQCPGQEDTWCCNTGAAARVEERVNRTNTTCCGIGDLVFNTPEPVVYTTARLVMGLSFSIGDLSRVSDDLGGSDATARPTMGSDVSAGESAGARLSSSLAIGLGASLGGLVAVVLAVGVVCYHRRRRKRRVSENLREHGREKVTSNEEVFELTTVKEPTEMMVREPPAEMMGTRADPVELQGRVISH